MNTFNRLKLSDLAKQNQATNVSVKSDMLDLVLYDLDYLGNLDVESKYLQSSTLPWLIAQVRLLELNKRVNSITLEVNVRKNTLVGFKNELKPKQLTSLIASKETTKRVEFINHRLTNMFKLSQMQSEKNCFAYFYRQDGSFNYTLHAFSSNKSNLVQVLSEFQMDALKIHENHNQYEKMFDFKIVNKIKLTKDQLNNPNFMDTYLEKSVRPEFIDSSIVQQQQQQVLIKFTSSKLGLEITNEQSIEKDYQQISYLNSSITNKNYFCLAYNNEKPDDQCISGLILFSKDVAQIDDVIREYAIKISTELNGKRASTSKLEQHTCFLCPMQQYVELCAYLNTHQGNDEKVYKILNEKISYNLDKQDQNYLLDCLNEQNLNLNSYEDLQHTNQLLVALIQKLCKSKQNQHLIANFNPDKASGDALMPEFTLFLMRNPKQSKSHTSNMINDENYFPGQMIKKRNKAQRSNTIETSQVIELFDTNFKPKKIIDYKNDTSFLSRNIFSSINQHKSSSNMATTAAAEAKNSTTTAVVQPSDLKSNSSLRRFIFHRIVGSPNNFYIQKDYEIESNNDCKSIFSNKQRFKFKYDAIQLWKKVISEQILLIKMEKENKRLRQKALTEMADNQNSDQTSRFSYVEITPCLKEVETIWRIYLNNETHVYDMNEIKQVLIKGIPQQKRGDVWFWLIKQYKLRNAAKCTQTRSQTSLLKLDTSYEELLKQYSIHQHSILLDLGRTYPNHPNFKYQSNKSDNESKSIKYGLGQLALFNVLKAYSILDNEVGYCQGLSFVVGFLLIQVNNDEEKAFELIKFLLIDLNLREQYLPNMKDLQKHMYQMSRLINENCSDVYFHLENSEISTSLYAASWFLTLFSSHFQMGFIARVFDFLFFEGTITLFKISLAILTIHKPILLSCNSFEGIVDQLKITIPEMSLIESELIINKSVNYEIESMLHTYQIEFNILNEEFDILNTNTASNSTNVNKTITEKKAEQDKQQRINQLELDNSKLRNSLDELNDKIKICHLKMENQEDYILKLYHENRQLKVRIDTLEIERDVILKKVHQQQEKLYFNSFQ